MRLAVAHVAVDDGGVGPVRLGRHDAKAMALHQPLRDRRARPVELGRAVAGLAEQHHAAAGIAVEGLGEGRVVDVRQGLHGLADARGQAVLRGAQPLAQAPQRAPRRRGVAGLSIHGDARSKKPDASPGAVVARSTRATLRACGHHAAQRAAA
ncbi:hypothetical protein [Lysobacter sp. N42]|uniref:hypothetical protein n=1 Tax=Lysobacter sp. N42 TaxID=2545719 RepID=UPI001FB67BE1|nr:hypothetical protein [Lysobacter sp. N42]